MSEFDCITAPTVTKTVVVPHIWQDLQDAVNQGIDYAEREFPVGTIIKYDYTMHHACKVYRMQLAIVSYNEELPTIFGPAPGMILQHLTAYPVRVQFCQKSEAYPDGTNRYLYASVNNFLRCDGMDRFWSGLPQELVKVVTPLRLEVPFYEEGKPASTDFVEAPFFLPSIEEIGFDQNGQVQPAFWPYFREHHEYCFRDPWGDKVYCFSRSAAKGQNGFVWTFAPDEPAYRGSVLNSYYCAPAFAIAKRL